MTANPHTDPTRRKANLRIAAVFTMVVVGMVGMAYASVPLYRVFCQVTGFGGTPRISSGGGKVLDQKITVAFDSNVNRGMP
ncbi:MAG TPA: cytochrome c oxidase assembly protein, partial [Rhizobiales bacterium]|nr:cytochrome c oxidase assembly protein [Hyphomicrobiales bacterium]